MNLTEIMETVSIGELFKNSSILLLLILTLIQISPIKLNPWRWIAKWIGRAVNGEVIHEVEHLKQEVVALRESTTEQAVINCRVRILRFGDELLQDVHHSKDCFDQTLRDIDAYETYCHEHPDFKNNVTIMTVQHIKEVYNQLLSTGEFL